MLNPFFITASPPSSVSHSKKGHFTSPSDVNLIVCKSSRLEIFVLTETGTELVRHENLFATILFLELFRPNTCDIDYLFLCTDRFQYAILSWSETQKSLILEKQGSFSEKEGRPYTNGPFGFIDSKACFAVLALYQGWLTILPLEKSSFFSFRSSSTQNKRRKETKILLTSTGCKKEFYTIRFHELNPLAIVETHQEDSSFAILYKDVNANCNVRTYTIRHEGLIDGSIRSTAVHPKSHTIIPMPQGGFLVFGDVSIQYIGEFGRPPIHMLAKSHSLKCWSPIDPDFSRILIGELHGYYSVLFLNMNVTGIQSIDLQYVGRATSCTTLTYLDNGFAFLGSHFGDSALIRLLAEPNENGSNIEIISIYSNIGPVVDFLLMEPRGHPGSSQLVTCSGAFNDSTLKVIRHGMEFKSLYFLEVPLLKRVFALGCLMETSYQLIALSTDTSTVFMSSTSIPQGESVVSCERELRKNTQVLSQVYLPLISDQPTLLMTQIDEEFLIQATPSGIFIHDFLTLSNVSHWTLPSCHNLIDVCYSVPYLLAASRSSLYCLELSNRTHLKYLQSSIFNSDIACVDLCPSTNLAAVGLWNGEVLLLTLPSLDMFTKIQLPDVCTRSICVANWSEEIHVLCGFGDGKIIYFHLSSLKRTILNEIELKIGTHPIRLSRFKKNGRLFVFACCDRPVVFSGSIAGKLLYSNINLNDVVDACTLRNTFSGNEILLVATLKGLFVGLIDPEDNLHVTTHYLGGDMGRKLLHHSKFSALIVLTERSEVESKEGLIIAGFVKMFDDLTFDLLSEFRLESRETPQSLCIFFHSDETLLAVGTAFEFPNESEPKSGRLLLFTVETKKLILLHEIATSGAVYSLVSIHQHLVAGINHRIQLYAVSDRKLVPKCEHYGNILILYLDTIGDYIVVGDMMKSVSLWQYHSTTNELKLVSRDPSPHWLTAIAALSENYILASDANNNIFIAKRPEKPSENQFFTNRMEIVAEFHIGEFINRFFPGYFHPAEDCIITPLCMSASINGHIGLIGHVPSDKDVTILAALQNAVKSRITSFFMYDEYRSFNNERKKIHAHGIIDGDMVCLFSKLSDDQKLEVAYELSETLQMSISVSTLARKVEDIARLL